MELTHPPQLQHVSARASPNCHQSRSSWPTTPGLGKTAVNGSTYLQAPTWRKLVRRVAELCASRRPTRSLEKETPPIIGSWATSFCKTTTLFMTTLTQKWDSLRPERWAATQRKSRRTSQHLQNHKMNDRNAQQNENRYRINQFAFWWIFAKTKNNSISISYLRTMR